MAPKNNKIWTLSNINKRYAYDGDDGSKNNPSSDGNNKQRPQTNDSPFPGYCQPILGNSTNFPPSLPRRPPPSSEHRTIRLCHIPNLTSSDVCEGTLHRILQEFEPIIRRRGYSILSISEMCCCGDGLDYQPQQPGRPRRRKLRKQSSNVWGYNQTRFATSMGRRRTTTHTIHLRLRDPTNHNILLPWEDVAGTMAHEMSHCVHQNHGKGFYRLMEEILEEHATLQVNKFGLSFAPVNANAIGRQVNKSSNDSSYDYGSSSSSSSAASMPTVGGQRLGGSKTSKGKSRLVTNGDDGNPLNNAAIGKGQKLGGGSKKRHGASLREAMAKAAETRRTLMERTKRMIERSKEPCVIEILDDDDDDDNDDNRSRDGGNNNILENKIDVDGADKNRKNKQPNLKLPKTSNNRITGRDTTATTTKTPSKHERDRKRPASKNIPNEYRGFQPSKKKQKTTLVDLTGDIVDIEATVPAAATATAAGLANANKNTNNDVSSGWGRWSCSVCTFRNRALALTCDMCRAERSFD